MLAARSMSRIGMHRDDVSLRFGMPARGSRIPRFEDETSASEAETFLPAEKEVARASVVARFKTF